MLTISEGIQEKAWTQVSDTLPSDSPLQSESGRLQWQTTVTKTQILCYDSTIFHHHKNSLCKETLDWPHTLQSSSPGNLKWWLWGSRSCFVITGCQQELLFVLTKLSFFRFSYLGFIFTSRFEDLLWSWFRISTSGFNFTRTQLLAWWRICKPFGKSQWYLHQRSRLCILPRGPCWHH